MPDPATAAVDVASIHQHLEDAQERAHPLSEGVEARPDLHSAVEFLCGYSKPGHLDAERKNRLRFLDQVVRSLGPVDERLRGLRSRAARKLLRTFGRKPSVAVWAALIRAMEWPDNAVVEGLICGFPTVGHYPDTGIFQSCDRPAEQLFESLDHRAHNARLAGTLLSESALSESTPPVAVGPWTVERCVSVGV